MAHTKNIATFVDRFVCSFVISSNDEELELPSLYWIPTFYLSVHIDNIIVMDLSDAQQNLFSND